MIYFVCALFAPKMLRADRRGSFNARAFLGNMSITRNGTPAPHGGVV